MRVLPENSIRVVYCAFGATIRGFYSWYILATSPAEASPTQAILPRLIPTSKINLASGSNHGGSYGWSFREGQGLFVRSISGVYLSAKLVQVVLQAIDWFAIEWSLTPW